MFFTLSNGGPFPVTIRKLGFLQLGAVNGTGGYIWPAPHRRVHFSPWGRFTLAPGDAVRASVVFYMVRCMRESKSRIVDKIPVRHRALGLPHETWVSLPVRVEVVGTARSC